MPHSTPLSFSDSRFGPFRFGFRNLSNGDGSVYLPGPGVWLFEQNGFFFSPIPCVIPYPIQQHTQLH